MNAIRQGTGKVLGAVFLVLIFTGSAWAQAGGHASVGLGHGEEGYLHLQEMIKHLEFALKMDDANPQLRQHGQQALAHAKEALRHYNEALVQANESLGRSPRNPMMGEGSPGEGSDHREGSGPDMGMPYEGGPPMGGMPGMPEGSEGSR